MIGGGGGEGDGAGASNRDVDEAGLAGGEAGGLKKGGEDGGFIMQVVKFLDVIVIKDDVDTEDVFDDVHGLAGEDGHAGVFDGEDSDGLPGVNFLSKLCLSKVVAEGTKRRVLRENVRDVKGIRRRN